MSAPAAALDGWARAAAASVAMHDAARAGDWDAVEAAEATRAALLADPQLEAAVDACAPHEQLQLRAYIEQMLLHDAAVTALARAGRDDIGAELASRSNTRRLRDAYGSA